MNIKNIIQLLLQSSSDFNKLHDYVITELSKAVNKSVNEANPEELFKIAKTCTPTEKDRVQALLDAYNNAVLSLIKQGITKAVLFSTNTQQNALSAFTRFEGKEVDAWRKETARAFIESRMKRDNGLNLSDRVWNYTQQTKSEFEVAVSQVLANGIGKGISAESLGRQVRQYLNNPDMMYRRYHRKQLMSDGTKKDIVEWRRRVIDKEGKVRFIKEDLAKVGTGVYRSARQNALRLTITETNMAYNYSNCKRWESEPFVLGIRIRLSANHPEEDICDELAGDYPKTFMWRGWHPRCMCSVSPILMDRKSDEWKKLRKMPKEEYEAYQSPNLVQNVPDKFSKWCERNAKKLDLARKSGKLPYFVKDNQKVVGNLLGWKEKQVVKPMSSREKILAAAKARHEERTENDIKYIQRKWDYRKYLLDPNYRDVAFNVENSGLKATHVGHNLDKDKGWYETTIQDVGYKYGHSVILEKEPQNVYKGKSCEGFWDALKFEVAGAESGTPNNIRNALKHCASKPDSKIAVLFFPNENYSSENFQIGLAKFNGLKGTSQHKIFDLIYCIQGDKIIQIKKPS